MSDDIQIIYGDQDVSDIVFAGKFDTNYTRPSETDAYENSKYTTTSNEKYSLSGAIPEQTVSAMTNFNFELLNINRRFDPARQKRIGSWFPIGFSDTGNPINNYVSGINPFRSRMQEGIFGSYTGMCTNGTYANRICRDYDEYFLVHVAQALLGTSSVNTTAAFPSVSEDTVLMFDNPHGGYHPNKEGYNPISAIVAREDGLPHLVDYFYGRCETLVRMGIRPIVMLGSPDTNNFVKDPNDPKWISGLNMCKDHYVIRGFDSPLSFPENSITADAIKQYNNLPYGVVINDVPNSTDHPYWMNKNYTICVKESRLKNYFYSGGQPNVTGASGNYPNFGTASWTGMYGGTQWIVAIEPTSFNAISGSNTPYGTTGNITGWVNALATGSKLLAQQLGPNTIILLPHILWHKSGEIPGWFAGNVTTGLFWR